MSDLNDAPVSGGISFKTPIFSFGNTVPDVNSGFSFDLPLATIQSFSQNAMDFSANNSTANKAFLNNVIQSSQAQVAGSVKTTTAIQNQSLTTLKDFASKLSNILTPSSGCFITTAICDTMGLDDNCYYLKTLRDFRDNVMLKNQRWRGLVEDYYQIAPGIVKRINAKKNAMDIYITLSDRFLVRAVKYVEAKDDFMAIQTYREMVIAANALSA